MPNFGSFAIIFALLFSHSSVESFRCEEGIRLATGGMEIQNSLQSRECNHTAPSCHRLYASFDLAGSNVIQETGFCGGSASCELNSCDVTERQFASVNMMLRSCCFYCCNSENCNSSPATSDNGECSSATTVASSIFIMMITTFLVLSTVRLQG